LTLRQPQSGHLQEFRPDDEQPVRLLQRCHPIHRSPAIQPPDSALTDRTTRSRRDGARRWP
jgi:hypothetical protein